MIHCAAHDFGKDEREPLRRLAEAYEGVLLQFVWAVDNNAATELRLLPLSGGLFAGRYRAHMAQLTWQSLHRALTQLKPRERGQLARAGVKIMMCVYDAEEAKQFESRIFPAALLRDVGAMVRAFVDIFKSGIHAVDVGIFYDVYRHTLSAWWDQGTAIPLAKTQISPAPFIFGDE